MKKRVKTITASVVCVLLALMFIPLFAGCGGNKSSIVIMTEDLSGLFNPFYATTGTDQTIVGVTQIGMLSTDKNGDLICGEDEDTVVLAYDYETPEQNPSLTESTYRFVIKNDLYFSDGTPLTINDVIFNMYEYLDPVYTGSSTMYSTEIVGLESYRTQENLSSGSSSDDLDADATSNAKIRIDELISVYHEYGKTTSSGTSYYMTEDEMRDAINNKWSITEGYYKSIGLTMGEEGAASAAKTQLLSDYEHTIETFQDELDEDYISAKEAFDVTAAPYNSNEDMIAALQDPVSGEVFKFMMYEGYVSIKYATNAETHRDDPSVIESFTLNYDPDVVYDEETAKDRVYRDNIRESLDTVLSYWGTASTLTTEYAAEYKSIQLQSRVNDDGSLLYPYIEGIASLGHKRDGAYLSDEYVTVNGKQYKVARNHNEDGTPSDEGTYDILEVKIDGTDPKAIYNFSFSVAPQHYYAKDDKGVVETMDIENNQFGVKYADYDFQANTIQSELHNGVPVGAGPFKATNRSNDDTGITRQNFWNSGNVYFKANDNFMFDVKSENIIFQEVSSTNAIDKLERGEIDYAEPQFTATNYNYLTSKSLSKKIGVLEANQLGYGYVGINAGKVPSVNLRKAIMSAMETSLATQYYAIGTCQTIYWPMSVESWAYPITGYNSDGTKILNDNNGHEYAGQWAGRDKAVERIESYMQKAAAEDGMNITQGSSDLKMTFTISGSSISDHPTYQVFLQAMELLNECGWNVEVRADSQALTKLATGSLTVWAAAWGSTVDPDMYQVYHFNSTASSTYAWGYREIKADQKTYAYEYDLIKNTLSPVIDAARETADQDKRAELYEEAMGYVLDLAIELPVYQRENLYAYNIKTLGGLNEDVNPYSSPLEKIWEIYLI